MSRQQTGKTSIVALWIRWNVVWFILMLPLAWLMEPVTSTILWMTPIAATIVAVGLSIFMRVWGGIVNGGSPDYRAWLAAGGSPFWDTLHWPLNPDPPQVRAAIGVPPPTPYCKSCGASLAGVFGLGGNYGNCCNHCGTYNDRFGLIDVGG